MKSGGDGLLVVSVVLAFAASACGVPDPQMAFENPPKEAHAGVWWHWMGAQVTKDGIEKDLDWFGRMGITSATIFGMADSTVPWAKRIADVPTGGLRPYSDAWWRLVAFACEEGKKRGIDIGIHNCPGYTSSGGKWIPHRLAMRELVFGVKDPAYDISTIPSAPFPVYNEDRGSFEKPDCPARRSDYKPIAVVRGVAVGHVPMGSYVQPADWESFGLECDKMNPEAVAFHMDHVIAELKRHLGPDLRAAGLQHVLLDSYEAGTPTWTPKMREEFKVRRGYDPLDYLPILGGYTNLYTAAECTKFKADFDRTVQDLYRDVLFRIMHDKLSAEGLQFSCEPYTGPFSSVEVSPYIDRILTEFWLAPKRPPHGLFNTFPAPGGGLHGIVEAEAFTSVTQWDETPAALKVCGDAAWLAGVNRFVLHSCVLQPWGDDVKPGVTMGRWGSHFGRNQTWAEGGRAWFDYVARSQAILQWGRPSAAKIDVPFAHIARTDGNRTIFFLVNDSDVEKALGLPKGSTWFDPVDGNVGEPPAVLAPRQSGFCELPEKGRSVFARTGGKAAGRHGHSVAVSGWVPELGDWTKSDNPEIRYFSGTRTYRARFSLADGKGLACAQAKIELGKVLGATVQVRVNGRDLGIVWCAPWRVKVPAGVLQIGVNTIEIDVTNVWRNRLVGDEREAPDMDFAKAPYPGGDMLLSYPGWFMNGIATRPSKRRKCFTTWRHFTKDSDLVPSGLAGPVSVHVSTGRLVIAERGKTAEYSIVIPAKASPSQKYAADEMRSFVAMASGVRLPIVTDAEPIPPKAILLGETRWTNMLAGPGKTNIGKDGFRLVARPPHLLVVALPERGTLYGVYEILERFAGCRWYSSWRTVIPSLGRIEVPAGLDETQIPAFAMREPYWADVTDHPVFAARLKVNSRSWRRMDAKFGGEPYRFGGGLGSCHTFNALLPPKKYFDAHPEYFHLTNGRRAKEQPCLTNPDVLRIVISNVLERIRKDPGAKFYGVSQNDCGTYCTCHGCKAVNDEEGSPSGTVVRFVNAVAEAVEKEFPDAIIETLAYEYSRKAPKKTKLRHNVVPCLCTLECDFALPIDKSPFRQNIAFRRDIEDWSRMTDFLYVWDYTTDFSHYALPWPNVYALQDNIRFFRQHNVKALFAQGAYHGRHADFGELKAWLLAKWMWNPDLPMKPLLDDFFAGYYGRGAPFVREYFERIHQLQTSYSAQPNHPLLIFDGVENPAISDAFLEEAADMWAKAIAATKDDAETSYNVRMGAFTVDYARMERSRKLLNLNKNKHLLSPGALKVLAKSLLDRVEEAKDMRLSEYGKDAIIAEWRKIAEGRAVLNRATNGELEEDFIPLKRRGIWGDIVDDPKAGDGRALKLFNTHSQWCIQLPMDRIGFEPGKKYRLSVRVRVDKAGDGEAFCAGVYSKAASRTRRGIELRTKDALEGGYRWYDVITWIPAPDEYFWMAPGRFNKDGKSAINGIYVDKIKFSALNKQGGDCRTKE